MVFEAEELTLMDRLARRFEAPRVHPDPVRWAEDVVDAELYSKQREILRLIEFVPKLAVPSCHSSGKTRTAALAAARFLAKYPPGTARVVTTAPSGGQVRGVIWNEINAIFDHANEKRRGALPGRVNQTEWWIGNWMAGVGRKPKDRPKTDNEVRAPETFQGLHAEHLLVIIDEAGGVPDELWIGVDTLVTNVGAKILAIGNPDDPETEFARVIGNALEPDDAGEYNDWTVVKIPAWETPNLSGEPVASLLNRVLLSREWVADKRRKWGEDSGLWAAKVAADFPSASQLTVVRVIDATAARYGLDADDLRGFEDVQLGVDIAASETGDETVVRERRGRRLLRRWSCRSKEPEDVTELIVQAQRESGATLIHVDATGVGFGFLSDVRKEVPGVSVQPFVAAARATDPGQYENRRAEAHWYLRDELRRHALDMSETEDADDAIAQLTTVRYRIKNGRIVVEAKDDIRRRTGRSPDDADAIILAVLPPGDALAPAPATVRAASRTRREQDKIARVARERSTELPPSPHHVPERIVSPRGEEVRRRAGKRRTRVLRAR